MADQEFTTDDGKMVVPPVQVTGRHRNSSGDSNNEKTDVAVSSAIEISEADASRALKEFKLDSQWDPNMSNDALDEIDAVVGHHDADGENKIIGEITENSPYPEVRAAVRNYDIDVPCNTVRAWVLGMLMMTVGSGLNMLFSLRNPSITITSSVSQLIIWPVGVAWDKVMPKKTFHLFGKSFSLVPGPFNIKEHALIVIMANAAYGGGAGYFTDILTAQRGFYGLNWGWGFSLLCGLTTQIVGFGLAGLARRWLVEPAAMIWPSNLVNTSLMYALHDHSKTNPETSNGWSISRYRYFFYVFAGSFLWYFFPGVIAQFLSVFAFATWIAPNNVVVNQVFGGFTGMSLLPITFDWTYISGYIFSPLISPWHAIGNTLIGCVLWIWVVGAGIHFSGSWYADWLPFSDSDAYDNTQSAYNTSRILTPEFTFDAAKYEAYSPLFLSTTFALCYGLSFAAISSVIVHTALFHGRQIIRGFRASRTEIDDVHAKLMRKYVQVPDWWFGLLAVTMMGLSFAVIYAWPTHMSWWALILAFAISTVWMIPIGMINAITNVQLGLNVFTEFIIGYAQPGKPNAMMLFKTYGYITMTQGLAFTADMKLGHYLKLPPRTLFAGQVVGTIWSVIVQTAVFEWAFGGGIEDICTSTQSSRFTCPNGRVFFNASVIWGVIGPARIFSGPGIYKNLQYFWLIGAALPVMIYFAARKWPRSNIRFLSAPVIFGGIGDLPPATPLNYLSWGAVGFVFNKFLRNRYRGWWLRFNYLTSAGLDIGLALCTILIVLTISLTNTSVPQWWGNVGAFETMDALDTAVKYTVADGETFGPATW